MLYVIYIYIYKMESLAEQNNELNMSCLTLTSCVILICSFCCCFFGKWFSGLCWLHSCFAVYLWTKHHSNPRNQFWVCFLWCWAINIQNLTCREECRLAFLVRSILQHSLLREDGGEMSNGFSICSFVVIHNLLALQHSLHRFFCF